MIIFSILITCYRRSSVEALRLHLQLQYIISLCKKYNVVFVRHGESVWNKENRFTGWTDVKLSAAG